jgi:transcriptional regulator with XRE-family HTH domain
VGVNQFKALVAKNIKLARSRLGLTQQELAELCGLSTNYLATVEIGGKFPSSDTLERLISALKLKPYELFIDDDDVEAFDRQELIARFCERATRYAVDGIEKAAKEMRPRK